MKIFACILAVVLGSVVAQAFSDVQVVRECALANNPDTGVRVKILDVGEQSGSGLLVAVILSAGNIKPFVMAAYPVTENRPNGARITGYSGKNFSLTINSLNKRISLKTSGAIIINISGRGPFFNCD